MSTSPGCMVNMIELSRNFDLQIKALHAAEDNGTASPSCCSRADLQATLNEVMHSWNQHSGPPRPASTRSRRR